MITNFFYVPIYVTAREFNAKVLLSGVAAERGFEVYLGTEISINNRLSQLPEGIYFGKDTQPNKVRWFDEVRGFGHGIVATDEEYLFVRDFDVGQQWFVQTRIGAESLARLDAFLAPGEQQKNAVAHMFPGLKDRVHATGNPRLDLMRPEFSSHLDAKGQARRMEIGPYILINSNFGEANYLHAPDRDLLEIYKQAWSLSDNQLQFFRDKLEFEKRIFQHFLGLADRLAAEFPDICICIRPHPMEKHEPWLEIASRHPNVIVRFEGTAIEWSAGALATLHNSCTTGLEAALAGYNVLAYRPETSEAFEFSLPNTLSRQFDDAEPLISTLRDVISGGDGRSVALPPDEIYARVGRAIEASRDLSASDRIVTVLQTVASSRPRPTAQRRFKWFYQRFLRGKLHRVREALRKVRGNGLPSASANNRVRPFSAADVSAVLSHLHAASGRFAAIRCEDVGADLVRIYSVGRKG